jgi:hypothetical protein
MFADEHVFGVAQLPQLAIRSSPQLSLPATLPQVFASCRQNAGSPSGWQIIDPSPAGPSSVRAASSVVVVSAATSSSVELPSNVPSVLAGASTARSATEPSAGPASGLMLAASSSTVSSCSWIEQPAMKETIHAYLHKCRDAFCEEPETAWCGKRMNDILDP